MYYEYYITKECGKFYLEYLRGVETTLNIYWRNYEFKVKTCY